MTSGIYLIVNRINDMIYIGSAVNVKNRWKNHLIELRLNRHHNPYLQNAYNKYGEDNLGFSILEHCDRDKLAEREQFWLDYTKCYDRERGYNLQKVVGSNLGLKVSEETKTKLSALRKGVPRSEEVKIKIKNTMKGRQFSPETREKMRRARLGRKLSEETKSKMSESRKGNKNAVGSARSKEHLDAMFAGRKKKLTPI